MSRLITSQKLTIYVRIVLPEVLPLNNCMIATPSRIEQHLLAHYHVIFY